MLMSKLGAVTLKSFPNKYLSQNKNHIQKNSTLLIIIMIKWDWYENSITDTLFQFRLCTDFPNFRANVTVNSMLYYVLQIVCIILDCLFRGLEKS